MYVWCVRCVPGMGKGVIVLIYPLILLLYVLLLEYDLIPGTGIELSFVYLTNLSNKGCISSLFLL